MLSLIVFKGTIYISLLEVHLARPGGNPDLQKVRNVDTEAANSKRRALADDYAHQTGKKLREAFQEHGSGLLHVDYAKWLNDHGWPTRRGSRWTATQVARVFKRLGLPERQERKRGVRKL